MAKVEIACFNAEAAIIASNNGADRVELCAQMTLGGTTPSLEDVQKIREAIGIDLNVMIRPRGGDFVYSEEEFEQMKREVAAVKTLGVNGLVFGILTADNEVDIERNKALVALAHPLSCTFHRAFDQVSVRSKSLEDVISCGFKTILTSGCEPNVDLGLNNLKELVKWADGRIVIMPGGGLRSTNVKHILDVSGATYVHSSAITDGSETAVAEEVRAIKANL